MSLAERLGRCTCPDGDVCPQCIEQARQLESDLATAVELVRLILPGDADATVYQFAGAFVARLDARKVGP